MIDDIGAPAGYVSVAQAWTYVGVAIVITLFICWYVFMMYRITKKGKEDIAAIHAISERDIQETKNKTRDDRITRLEKLVQELTVNSMEQRRRPIVTVGLPTESVGEKSS